jgi:hypothetical protein
MATTVVTRMMMTTGRRGGGAVNIDIAPRPVDDDGRSQPDF